MEDQLVAAEAERKEAVKREEKMQQLLETALNRPATETEEKIQQLLEATLNKQADPTQQASKIPSNATPAPVLVQNASLREFATWKQKLYDYMLLTGIDKANNERKKAVLRSLLDDEWFRIAKFAIDVQMDDENATVETVIEKMQEYLRSQRNVVIDRKEFYCRNQQEDEKFDDYYVALQEIAAFCEFCPHCTTEQFRDRIVTGIRNEETVRELLAEKDLTLKKAVDKCRANENASHDTESLQATATGVNRIAKYKKPSTQNQRSNYGDRYNKAQPWQSRNNRGGTSNERRDYRRNNNYPEHDGRNYSRDRPPQNRNFRRQQGVPSKKPELRKMRKTRTLF